MQSGEPTAEAGDSGPSGSERLAGRLGEAALGMMDLCAIYIGDRLGYYAALAEGEATSAGLAARTGTAERYAREWLEQQTIAGLLDSDGPEIEAADRRFRIPADHVEVLTDSSSPIHCGPLARMLVGATRPLAAVVDAYRTGGGVTYDAYGIDMSEGLAEGGKAARMEQPGAFFPAIPELHVRLLARPPARIADIGCGAGWSSIGAAQVYSEVLIDGFDLDEASVAAALRNVREAGLGDRIRIEHRDAAAAPDAEAYDLVMVISSLHDMTDPVAVLRAARRLVRPNGFVLVAEGKTAERFLGEGTDRDLERWLYGFSVLHCLPVSMSEAPAAGAGTAVRPDAIRAYARDAGFTGVEIVRVDDPQTTLYRMLI